MKNIKKLSINRLLLCLLLPLMIMSLMLGIVFSDKSAKAWDTYPYSDTTVKDPIYDYSTLSYDEDALNELAGLILKDEQNAHYGSSPTIQNLIDYIKTFGLTGGIPVTNKEITFNYGKFNIFNTVVTRRLDISKAPNLIWMPVYMSTTKTETGQIGDAVLTLYLAATGGTAATGNQDKGYFTNNGGYNTSPTIDVPSNMYGTSYLRVENLGNPGKYATYTGSSFSTTTKEGLRSYGEDKKYMDFFQYDNVGATVYGNLSEDIVTPSRLAWQSGENFQEAVIKVATTNNTDVTINGTDVKSTWTDYIWPNEAYGDPIGAGSFHDGFNYVNKKGYDAWQNDKVWIPSLTEVGTGDKVGSNDTTNGLWKLSKKQRANQSQPANGTTGGDTWLRTANTEYLGSGGCTYAIFGSDTQGNIMTYELGSGGEHQFAVRPAIHLNLSTVLKKLSPPVDLPDTVTTVYDATMKSITDNYVTEHPDEYSWWVKGDSQPKMYAEFYTDADCKTGVAPVDAGEYYLLVKLNDSSLYFARELLSVDQKVVKFVVQKKTLGIKWEYEGDDNKPKGVEWAEKDPIYERDIKMGREPKLGIRYNQNGGLGIVYYDYNELLRGTYDPYAVILNEDIYDYNYEIDKKGELGDHYVGNSFVVGRKIVDVPYFYGYDEGTTTISVPYAGDQYVQIANASKYFKATIETDPAGLDSKNLGLTDDGKRMTFKVKERGTYKIDIMFQDHDPSRNGSPTFAWADSNYSFDSGNQNEVDNEKYASKKTFIINVTFAEIEVDFVGLSAECTPFQEFSLDIRGIYNYDPVNAPVNMSVYCQNSQNGKRTYFTVVDGVVSLNGLDVGEYIMYAAINDNNYGKYYTMATKEQKFKVIPVTSSLTDNQIEWYYTHDGQASSSYARYEHDEPDKALEFDYDGEYYVFALTLSETTLHNQYYVKAIYSGDTFVKDAGLHCVTVNITAFYKDVQYDAKEFKIYFRIKQIKLDITCLEWDYEAPFEYDATIKYVRLTADSLALIPGLTAQYTTIGSGRNAGDYVTEVTFALTESYAINYFLPTAGDESTYDGVFSFTCEWKINKAKLTVEWDVPEGNGDGTVVVPTLKNGKEFVEYIFEHKEADGSWTPAENLTAAGAAETYRVKAVLKPEYSSNYELENDEPCEFLVPSGKSAVSVHFEHDGEIVLDGAEFPYSGNPLTFTLAVDGGGLAEDGYTFKYYSINGGGTRTELDGAPVEVGSYAAVVTAQNGSNTYLSGETDVVFYIVKADYDPAQIYWYYEHGNTKISATYDKEQGKWVDDQGREVLFSFEYDGTEHKLEVVCLQDFTDHPEDAISVLSLSGNYATNANSVYYTAVVKFNYNPEHYNNPTNVFPELLSWQIRKAIIDYSNVRWGYIDSYNIEHDFDFYNNSFTYTRDENGAVDYTVALLGIPEGLKSLMRYTTQDLSVNGSVAQEGNTRAAVGDYLTTFTISGSWTNPNYEPFSAADFPATIPTMLTWQIERRDLAKIKYENGFTKFDNKTHNVLELCEIPEDQLYYFVVDITFVDSAEQNVENNYGGYDNQQYIIYHAGTYYVRLYEIVLVPSSDKKSYVESHVLWDFVEIIVEKNVLEAKWNDSGSYPVVEVVGVYSTDMIMTKYYIKYIDESEQNPANRTKYAEVSIEYIKSADSDEKFYAMASATEKYEKDIDIVFAEGVSNILEFSYEKFTPSGPLQPLEFPTFSPPFAYYTGKDITFTITDWVNYYSQYLYISGDANSDGKFAEKEIGTYHVVLRFKKDANAYWNVSNSIDTYNRDAHEMTFSIEPPINWALDYPEIENARAEYTGDYIDFKIVNWVAYSQYLTYEVFYKGESLGNRLSFRDGGIYTVVFSFPEGSIGYWRDDPDSINTRKTYKVQILISGDPNEPLELLFPELNRYSASYTGEALQFRIIDWVTYFLQYAQYLEFELPEGVKFSGGIFTATKIKTYEIKVRIKEDSGYTFVDGTTEYTLTFVITIPQDGSNVEFPLPVPEFETTVLDYNGSEREFQIKKWNEIGYASYIQLTCDNGAVRIDGGTVRVTQAGRYTITISFKEGIKAYWDGTDFSREPKQIVIYVTDENNPAPPDGATTVGTPQLAADSKSYNGKEQTFELTGITNMDAVTISGDDLTQKNVGTYTVTITLKDPTKTTWSDGTTGAITLTFTITKGKLPDGTHVGVGNNGKPELQDADGNHVDSDFDFGDLFDVEFTDKDGNPVSPDDLVAGEEYNAKLVPNEDKIRESMEDADDILNDVKERNEAGGWDIVYTPDDEGGFNPLWFLIILASVYAVLLVIIVILARRRKRLYGGDDDDDEDYDDEDYDDDDDYEY